MAIEWKKDWKDAKKYFKDTSNSRWWVNQVVSSSNLVGFGFDAAFCCKQSLG